MKIIGVTFENDERIDYYRYYEPVKIGYNVVVENDSGKYFATVATEIHEIDEDKLLNDDMLVIYVQVGKYTDTVAFAGVIKHFIENIIT